MTDDAKMYRNIAHNAIAECVTDVRTTFWRLCDQLLNRHDNIEVQDLENIGDNVMHNRKDTACLCGRKVGVISVVLDRRAVYHAQGQYSGLVSVSGI